jgi:hypothetical protein
MFLGALASAAVAIFAVPANAVVYSSGFDPLSFSGTGFFEFDTACESVDGVYTQAECNVIFLGATVDLVETTPAGTGQLSFGSSTNIDAIVISGGFLVGVDSGLFGPAFISSCSDSLCSNTDPWWIQWQTELNDPVNLFTGFCSFDGDFQFCSPNQTPAAIAFNVTFTRLPDDGDGGPGVPEPGTLGLILGGVGAAWWARRRKAAA